MLNSVNNIIIKIPPGLIIISTINIFPWQFIVIGGCGGGGGVDGDGSGITTINYYINNILSVLLEINSSSK